MNSTNFDRLLEEWFRSEAPEPWRAPAGVLPTALKRVGRTRQRPRWLAMVATHTAGAAPGVRSLPVLQPALLIFKIVLIVALAMAAVGAAAWLLRDTADPLLRNGPLVYDFRRDVPGGGRDVRLMLADGSDDRLLLQSHGGCPSASADGNRIADSGRGQVFTRAGGVIHQLQLHEIDTGETRGLPLADISFPDDVALSPDGLTVAVTYWGDRDELELWVVTLDGGGRLRLVQGATEPRAPQWSPDGQWLAFTAAEGLYVARADGSESRIVAHEAIGSVSWSPDGERIVYSQGNGIFVVDVDGSQVQRLTNSPASHYAPAWSPDGSTIAFIEAPIPTPTAREVVAGAATRRIGLISADGGLPRYVDGLDAVQIFAWSPDSEYIAASANAGLWVAGVTEGAGAPVAVLRTPRPSCVLWLPEPETVGSAGGASGWATELLGRPAAPRWWPPRRALAPSPQPPAPVEH